MKKTKLFFLAYTEDLFLFLRDEIVLLAENPGASSIMSITWLICRLLHYSYIEFF